MGIQILKTAGYLPDNIFTNKDFEKFLDTSDEWIRSRTGILSRYFARNEGLIDLVINSVEKLDLTEKEKARVKIIIVSTSTSSYTIPTLASRVQESFFTKEDIYTLDINMGCSGFVAGLHLINNMLETGEYGLLIGGEKLTQILDFKDRSTAVLFGDGSGAALIKNSRNKSYFTAGTKGNTTALHYCNKLNMEGKEVYKFAITVIPKEITRFLSKIEIGLNEIDYFICHQANIRIIESIAKTLQVSIEKFPTNLYKTGNLSSASIPILLDEMKKSKILKRGNKLLFIGFGAGLSWSLAYLEW